MHITSPQTWQINSKFSTDLGLSMQTEADNHVQKRVIMVFSRQILKPDKIVT